MTQVGMEVITEFKFAELEKFVIDGARLGVIQQAEAIKQVAQDSMKDGGKDPSDKANYKTAPEGEPPYVHTGKFRGSIDIAETGGFYQVGPRYSEVGLRGIWFEYGGRAQPQDMKRKSRRGKRKWKNHPFITPAYGLEESKFVKRVAALGAFTGK